MGTGGVVSGTEGAGSLLSDNVKTWPVVVGVKAPNCFLFGFQTRHWDPANTVSWWASPGGTICECHFSTSPGFVTESQSGSESPFFTVTVTPWPSGDGDAAGGGVSRI